MSKGKIWMWGSLAALVGGMIYFRGDFYRYAKMKMM
jgi:hypothetical protein